jgi:putative ABC transport system permease protein
LGDSHKGFRVLGTDKNYFEHYQFSKERKLVFQEGDAFNSPSEVVLGASVARELHYTLGSRLVLSHGISKVAFRKHDDKPFKVVGILSPTGTPIDRTLHVSLGGIEAIHLGWEGGAPITPSSDNNQLDKTLTPTAITAFIVGLKSKIGIFSFQREVNTYASEPLMAFLPGVVLDELWQTIGLAEAAMRAISGFVLLAGLFGMLSAIYSTLNERRREMAILRACGAKPFHIFSLLVIESTALAGAGAILGFLLMQIVLLLAIPLLETRFGLFLNFSFPSSIEVAILIAVIALGALVGLVPAWRVYRNSLSDGLAVRV